MRNLENQLREEIRKTLDGQRAEIEMLIRNERVFKVRPSILSKVTTCLQLATVFLVLSEKHFQFFSPFSDMLYWLVGFFTISSGLHYIYYWFKMMGEGSLSQ